MLNGVIEFEEICFKAVTISYKEEKYFKEVLHPKLECTVEFKTKSSKTEIPTFYKLLDVVDF